MTKELIRKVGMRFLKPQLLSQIIDEDVIDNPDNYLPVESIHIGLASKSTLKKLLNCRYEFEESITQEQYKEVLLAAQALYKHSLLYTLKNMCNDDLWKHAIWADYYKRVEASWLDVEYFVQRFEKQL